MSWFDVQDFASQVWSPSRDLLFVPPCFPSTLWHIQYTHLKTPTYSRYTMLLYHVQTAFLQQPNQSGSVALQVACHLCVCFLYIQEGKCVFVLMLPVPDGYLWHSVENSSSCMDRADRKWEDTEYRLSEETDICGDPCGFLWVGEPQRWLQCEGLWKYRSLHGEKGRRHKRGKNRLRSLERKGEAG